MPDLFDNITDWLLNQALGDDDISVTLGSLAKRLQDGGIPIARISMGRSVLHPMIALINLEWNSDAANSGSGTLYQVARGSLAEFPVGSGPEEICLDSGVAGTSLVDSQPVVPATGVYYLVRGANACGVGGYGSDSMLGERLTAVCP